MVKLSQSPRGQAILAHFEHYFCLSLLMTLLFGGLLFIVSCRRDLYLRYTAAEARFWERVGFPPGHVSRALRQFCESSTCRYVLWFLVLGFAALTLSNAAAYFYFKHRLDQITI
jgi:hypothetical protein